MKSHTSFFSTLSFCFGLGILVTLFALHFLSPEFDPSWRMVSEYANGQYSWVLSLMFLFWALSSWTLVGALQSRLSDKWGKIGLILLFVSGIGEAMAAIFTVNHPLHGLAALIGIGSFPFAAILISKKLVKMKIEAKYKSIVMPLAHLSWISVVIMILSFVLLIFTFRKAGGNMTAGPATEIPEGVIAVMGWANRFLIVVYSAWLIHVAYVVSKINGTKLSS